MNNSILRAASAVMLAAAFALPAMAQDSQMTPSAHEAVTLGNLEITAGYARATLPNAPVGGGYVAITNHGSEDDTLVSVTSDFSDNVQLHNMSVVDDVMKMYEMEDGIPIPAGETVTLAPGGLHIMFMQLKEPLVEGTKVKVTLDFAKAGEADVMLDVRNIAAKSAGGMPEMKHGDDAMKPMAN